MLYHKYIISSVLFFLYKALPSENIINPIYFDFYRNYLNETFNKMNLKEVDNTTRITLLYQCLAYFMIETNRYHHISNIQCF